MARKVTQSAKTLNTGFAWAAGLLMFFPILWIILMSFHSEADSITTPFQMLTSRWSLDTYAEVQNQNNYGSISSTPSSSRSAPRFWPC